MPFSPYVSLPLYPLGDKGFQGRMREKEKGTVGKRGDTISLWLLEAAGPSSPLPLYPFRVSCWISSFLIKQGPGETVTVDGGPRRG